ncbi:MAG: hypothetical protein GY846_00990 [Deltaproteobacteria bacterium]|nr:hypothetical protein [Deltaproteobacteria bacterium]
MENSNICQTDQEIKMFREIRANLMHERDDALRYWQQIRERYVYKGRKYNDQEVVDWFMNAPFMEVKAVSEELGIDWKTIVTDVRRMVDPLRELEEKQALFPETEKPFVGNTGMYAEPRVIEDIDQCYFYHTIDLPGHGTIEGDWDLRNGINDYFGGVNFSGKKVLDVGTANGMLCFEIERQGGDVVAFDLSTDYSWDLVPYAKWKNYESILQGHSYHINKLNNAFWFCHRCLNSNAKVVYDNIYDIPEQIGELDIVVYGSILLHLRDPFLALQSGTKLTRGAVVVTDVLGHQTLKAKKGADHGPEEPYMKFLPDSETMEPKDTWWDLSPEVISRMLKVLGFEDIHITYHAQPCRGEEVQLYTVVGRRTS